MSKEEIDRIRALIYLYFEALEFRVKSELDNKTDRILLNSRNITYDDAVKILSLKDKIEIMAVIEKELYQLLDDISGE